MADDSLRGFRSLVQAWNETRQGEDDSCCGAVARTLARYVEKGPDNREYLYNVANWDLKRLETRDYWSRLRKPRIDLRVRVDAGALALEWTPRKETPRVSARSPSSRTDFVRFESGRAPGRDVPANPLMHIPALGSKLEHASARVNAAPSCEEHCLRAAVALMDSTACGLRASFEVRFVTRLVMPDPLARPRIEDLCLRRKEAIDKRVSAWGKSALEPYGASLRDFVRLARSCAGNPGEMTAALQALTSRHVSLRRVRQWMLEFDALNEPDPADAEA